MQERLEAAARFRRLRGATVSANRHRFQHLTLADHPHVASVHDLHVWEIASDFPSLSAHVLVHQGDNCHAIRRELEEMLRQRFDIEHTTLQVDHESPRVLKIGSAVPEHVGH